MSDVYYQMSLGAAIKAHGVNPLHTWERTGQLRILRKDASEVIQQAWRCDQTGEVEWHPLPIVTVPKPERDQPGQTQTYSAMQAGERVMQAIAGLTPWAQAEVLQWALEKVKR